MPNVPCSSGRVLYDIPFIFKDEHGEVEFNNDFIYDAKTDTWQWIMDNVDKGVIKPFGRVKLVRK